MLSSSSVTVSSWSSVSDSARGLVMCGNTCVWSPMQCKPPVVYPGNRCATTPSTAGPQTGHVLRQSRVLTCPASSCLMKSCCRCARPCPNSKCAGISSFGKSLTHDLAVLLIARVSCSPFSRTASQISIQHPVNTGRKDLPRLFGKGIGWLQLTQLS